MFCCWSKTNDGLSLKVQSLWEKLRAVCVLCWWQPWRGCWRADRRTVCVGSLLGCPGRVRGCNAPCALLAGWLLSWRGGSHAVPESGARAPASVDAATDPGWTSKTIVLHWRCVSVAECLLSEHVARRAAATSGEAVEECTVRLRACGVATSKLLEAKQTLDLY